MNLSQFPQFEPHAMPCEECGELVQIGSTDVAATVGAWATGLVRVLCLQCGEEGS